jgi:3-oxoacyl-[acyl-carrier protein] reductase
MSGDACGRPEPGVALVSGASGALGRAVAAGLDAHGYRTALLYRSNGDAARKLATDLEHPSVVVGVDVREWDQVTDAIDRVHHELGPISAVVNAAGVRADGLLAGQSPTEWRSVIDVNLVGSFHLTRAVLPRMLAQRHGRIVNIVSPVAFMGNAGQTAYGASKAGVIGLTRSLARECGRRGVTVNAVSPGYMETAMTESLPAAVKQDLLARSAIPGEVPVDEVVAAVLFLVGSSHVTGQVLAVDGGLS